MRTPFFTSLLSLVVHVACNAPLPNEIPSRPPLPEDARPGSCWEEDVTEAVIEETRRRVLVQQASVSTDGKTRYPARYRDEVTRTEISPRSSFWVEIPCKGKLIPDHIAALQRGLAVRGFFEGPITGRYDSATQEAVLRFQRTFDLNSDILSLKAATQLGLVQV